MGKRDRSGLLYLQRDGDVGLPFMGLGCYAYLGPFTGKIEIQVRRLIALGDAIDEIFQLGVLIIVLGDEGQGGVARINIYFVVELIFSNAAFQFGVQIGIGKLVFGDTLRLIVICQTCGGGVFSEDKRLYCQLFFKILLKIHGACITSPYLNAHLCTN